MTDEQIKALVKQTAQETVKELRVQGMIKDAEDANYRDISEMLKEYYKSGEKDKQMTYALKSVRFDPYYRILEKYYRDGEKIETLATDFGVDASTIARKKKELCIKLYHAII